jgi:hypothetical protein
MMDATSGGERTARRSRCGGRLRALLSGLTASRDAAGVSTAEKLAVYQTPCPTAAFYHEAPASSVRYTAAQTQAAVPRPAMTQAERLHLEIYGYV